MHNQEPLKRNKGKYFVRGALHIDKFIQFPIRFFHSLSVNIFKLIFKSFFSVSGVLRGEINVYTSKVIN